MYSAHDPSAVVDVGVLSESEAENTDEQTPSDTEQDLSTASEGSCTCKYRIISYKKSVHDIVFIQVYMMILILYLCQILHHVQRSCVDLLPSLYSKTERCTIFLSL